MISLDSHLWLDGLNLILIRPGLVQANNQQLEQNKIRLDRPSTLIFCCVLLCCLLTFLHAHASNAKSPTPYIPNETCRGTLPEQGLFLWQTRSSLRAEDKWYLVALGLPFENALERVERHASGFPPQTRGSTQTEQGLFSLGQSHSPLLSPLSPLLRPPPSILLGLYASRRFKHSSDKTACCL